jgi:hypothetical protein
MLNDWLWKSLLCGRGLEMTCTRLSRKPRQDHHQRLPTGSEALDALYDLNESIRLLYNLIL